MAQANERDFVIPLRKEWLKVQRYKRAGRAVKTIKAFIAKHMKVPDRDPSPLRLRQPLHPALPEEEERRVHQGQPGEHPSHIGRRASRHDEPLRDLRAGSLRRHR